MSWRPVLPYATTGCVLCGWPVNARNKGGEIRLALTIKAGGSLAICRPLRPHCATKAADCPDAALAALRRAVPELAGLVEAPL